LSLEDFWDVPHHHPYPTVDILIKETARKLKVSSGKLKVFTRSFVRLANDHIEEVVGFNSAPAHRACAALSGLIKVEVAKKRKQRRSPLGRDLPARRK